MAPLGLNSLAGSASASPSASLSSGSSAPAAAEGEHFDRQLQAAHAASPAHATAAANEGCKPANHSARESAGDPTSAATATEAPAAEAGASRTDSGRMADAAPAAGSSTRSTPPRSTLLRLQTSRGGEAATPALSDDMADALPAIAAALTRSGSPATGAIAPQPPGNEPAATLPTPEAFLQWMQSIKTLSAANAGADAAAPASSAPLPGVAGSAVTLAMVEALAGAANEAATPTTATPASATPLAALTATAAPVANPLPTAPPLPSPPPLRMDEGDWPQQLGEQIQWRLGVGIQEARIEISPRELGAVDVRLSVDDQGLKVQLHAAQAETRALLQAELPRLREALAQGGLALADAQVGREAPGQQSTPQQHPSRTVIESGAGREAQASEPRESGWRIRRGLLDDYA